MHQIFGLLFICVNKQTDVPNKMGGECKIFRWVSIWVKSNDTFGSVKGQEIQFM